MERKEWWEREGDGNCGSGRKVSHGGCWRRQLETGRMAQWERVGEGKSM